MLCLSHSYGFLDRPLWRIHHSAYSNLSKELHHTTHTSVIFGPRSHSHIHHIPWGRRRDGLAWTHLPNTTWLFCLLPSTTPISLPQIVIRQDNATSGGTKGCELIITILYCRFRTFDVARTFVWCAALNDWLDQKMIDSYDRNWSPLRLERTLPLYIVVPYK